MPKRDIISHANDAVEKIPEDYDILCLTSLCCLTWRRKAAIPPMTQSGQLSGMALFAETMLQSATR